MSPYIVTVKTPRPDNGGADPRFQTVYDVTRRAVATLDEARTVASGTVYTAPIAESERPMYARRANRIPQSGGTVGPLPDGTVIEVEPTTTLKLAVKFPFGADYIAEGPEAVIAAYNEAQTVGLETGAAP